MMKSFYVHFKPQKQKKIRKRQTKVSYCIHKLQNSHIVKKKCKCLTQWIKTIHICSQTEMHFKWINITLWCFILTHWHHDVHERKPFETFWQTFTRMAFYLMTNSFEISIILKLLNVRKLLITDAELRIFQSNIHRTPKDDWMEFVCWIPHTQTA